MTEKDLQNFPPLAVPLASLRIAKEEDGSLMVFDILRKKMVALTPEEFVRQNFIHWLISHRGYPSSHMANEVEIKLNDTRKRCDTVIYGHDLNPLMIIEYKAPDVEITQATFDQIVRYNMMLKAKYLVVSNGKNHYCCKIDYLHNSYNFVRLIPEYRDAIGMPGIN